MTLTDDLRENNSTLDNIFPHTYPNGNLSNSQSIGSFFGVAIGNNHIVACGIDGNCDKNHVNGWIIANSGGDPDFRDVIFADNQFIAVGKVECSNQSRRY